MRNLKAGEVAHLQVAVFEPVIGLLALADRVVRRKDPLCGSLVATRFFNLQTKRRIHHVVRALEHLVVADEEIRNELRKCYSRVRIELDRLIQPQRHFACRAACRRRNHLHALDACRSVARLIETQPAMHQRIIDNNLLRLDFLAFLHDRQLRPPLSRRSVGVILLSGFVALHGERQNFFLSSPQFDHVAGLSFAQDQVTAVTQQPVHNASREDQQQAGVDHVHRHYREAMAFRVQRRLVTIDNSLHRPMQLLQHAVGGIQSVGRILDGQLGFGL